MPIGVIVNALSVATGGLLGALLRGRLSRTFQEKLNLIFGWCSVGMGISVMPDGKYVHSGFCPDPGWHSGPPAPARGTISGGAAALQRLFLNGI